MSNEPQSNAESVGILVSPLMGMKLFMVSFLPGQQNLM